MTRIIRVIAQPRGNMLLIGIGGSGRQSLSRLAAYIIGFKVFQIEVTKHYRKNEFREGTNQSVFYAGRRIRRFQVIVTARVLIVCSHKFSGRRVFFLSQPKAQQKTIIVILLVTTPRGLLFQHDTRIIPILSPLTYFAMSSDQFV